MWRNFLLWVTQKNSRLTCGFTLDVNSLELKALWPPCVVFTFTLRPRLTSSFAAAVVTAAIRHRRWVNVYMGHNKLLSFSPVALFFWWGLVGFNFFISSEILYWFFFEKRVYSGQIWETLKQTEFLCFIYLFTIESQQGGIIFVELWSLYFEWLLF